MIRKILDVAVMVPDGRAAAKWYGEKLGFEVHDQDEHWITAGPHGSETTIHLCEGAAEPGNTGIGFVADSVENTCRELKSRGVRFTKEPSDQGFGTFAMFSDPYGNEYWLLEG